MLVVKPSTMKASFLSVSYVLVTKWYSSPKCITGKMWSYRIYWWFISSSSQPWTPYGFFPVRRRREVAVVLPAPKIHLWLVPVERWPCGQLRKNLGVMIFRRLHMTMLRLLGFHLWVICTILQWSDELPYQERAPLWPPTNKGSPRVAVIKTPLISLENFQEVMATGSHGQLTKPFHLTPGTACWHVPTV